MAENLGSYAVNIPKIFQSPGEALQSATGTAERLLQMQQASQARAQEAAERKAEKDEVQMYRKMQTIQDLSDLSKYQTPDAVANAIGNRRANEIKSKYIGLAKAGTVALPDIMEGINKEIQNTTEGMLAFQNEHKQFDEAAKALKQRFPDIDTTKLLKDYRADIVKRRLRNESEFTNPIEVPESQFVSNLSNPDYLSDYITGNKNLTEAIVSPKGVEKPSVFVGVPGQSMKYEAQMPFWKKPSFTQEQIQEGYLPKGFTPKLQLKASKIPLKDGEMPVVDEDVYDRFAQDQNTNLEIINATKQKYPDYSRLNDVEKKYAKRNVLFDKLSSLDQSDFYPTQQPSRTNISIPKEEKGMEGLSWVKDFKTKIESGDNEGAVNVARRLFAGSAGRYEFKDMKVAKDGGLRIVYLENIDGESDEKSEIIKPNDDNYYYKLAKFYQKLTGSDVKMERNVLGGKVNLSKLQSSKDTDKNATFTYGGKSYTRQQLEKGAKYYGLSLDDYIKELKKQ